MIKVYIISILFFFFFGCSSSTTTTDSKEIKNIILLIGDGMGSEHIKAGRWKSVGIDGLLEMDKLSTKGWIKTSSANYAITDSAAAATAMATGEKTNNGVVGLDSNLSNLVTILEEAQQHNKSVGLVTNVQITHATPASFAAHIDDRNKMIEIAAQLVEHNITVLLGGGENYFLPTNELGCFPELGKRVDSRNIINEFIDKEYEYVCDAASLEAIDGSSTDKLIGLFSDEGMLRPYTPTLEQMAQKALSILSNNPNGFFLMIEGGQIDWGSHSNAPENTMDDVILFDQVVKMAKDFTLARDDTLLIVTADHETGGMSVSLTEQGLPLERGPYYMPDGTDFYVGWLTNNHTDKNVLIMSTGYKSDLFQGTHENTYIHDVMKEAYDF